MLSQLINRDCQIVRRSASGSTDELGNDIPGEDIVETVCEIQQRQRTGGEREFDDAVARTEWLGFFLPGEDIDSGDAVLVDSHAFEVVGDPWPVRNPRTQAESHVEADLKRTAGSEDAS